MTNKIICFKAWCSGTSYNFPDRYMANDHAKRILIFTQGVFLASFDFFRIKEYKSAIRIVKKAIANKER